MNLGKKGQFHGAVHLPFLEEQCQTQNMYFLIIYRFVAYIPGIQFTLDKGEHIPTGWFHMTVVHTAKSPNFDFALFINGHEITTRILTTHVSPQTTTISTTETIWVGWSCTMRNSVYGSVIVDEMAMWNRALDANEVKAVYDMY